MKQCGKRFSVTYAGLRDSTGTKVNTAAHLHVFQNGVQTAVLVRNDGSSNNPIVYTEGAEADDNEYRATVSFDAPTFVEFRWHFPEIGEISDPVTESIQGPALTEPT